MSNITRGALIVLEGVDRSGKSTQSKKLVESLKSRNISAELMVFPDRTTYTGKLISQYLSNGTCELNDYAVHLLFTANRWENVDRMRKLLFEGTTLIVDRYSYSGMAFSAVKKGTRLYHIMFVLFTVNFLVDMNLEWCKQPETGLPKPDLVFLLTLTQEEMEKRPGFGTERYETLNFQKRVSELFCELCDSNWRKVDASGTVDEVHQVLLNETLQKIEDVKLKPLQQLDFSKQPILNGVHN